MIRTAISLLTCMAFAAASTGTASADSSAARPHAPFPAAHTVAAGTTLPAAAVQRGPHDRTAALSLPPSNAGRPRAGENPHTRTSRRTSGFSVVGTTLTALAVAVGVLFLLALLLRKAVPGAARNLPPEVFEVLGRAPLAERQQVEVVRFGQRLLLVSVGSSGAETLAEIDQPEEVERLTAICAQRKPSSATHSFRQVFDQFSRERPGMPRTRPAADSAEGRMAGGGSYSHG